MQGPSPTGESKGGGGAAANESCLYFTGGRVSRGSAWLGPACGPARAPHQRSLSRFFSQPRTGQTGDFTGRRKARSSRSLQKEESEERAVRPSLEPRDHLRPPPSSPLLSPHNSLPHGPEFWSFPSPEARGSKGMASFRRKRFPQAHGQTKGNRTKDWDLKILGRPAAALDCETNRPPSPVSQFPTVARKKERNT